MSEHTKQPKQQNTDEEQRRFAAFAVLSELIIERSQIPRGVLSSIVCTCYKCRLQELYVMTERAVAWADVHGAHGPLTFTLLSGGVTVTSAGTI